MIKNILTYGSLLLLGVLFGLGATYYKQSRMEKVEQIQETQEEVFQRPYSPVYGEKTAKVIVTEFLDPACETCRSFYFLVKQMVDANPGKVKVVIRYAPFHQGADRVVRILESARKRGKYDEVLSTLFKHQNKWAVHHVAREELVWPLLDKEGFNVEELKKGMESPDITFTLAQDLADVKTLGVRKTPGYFVNGKELQNFGYLELKALVENELKIQYP